MYTSSTILDQLGVYVESMAFCIVYFYHLINCGVCSKCNYTNLYINMYNHPLNVSGVILKQKYVYSFLAF